MMVQIGTPFAACVAEIPSSATSVAVSNPSPNRNPSGNMCQLRWISRNSGRNRRAAKPRWFSRISRSSST